MCIEELTSEAIDLLKELIGIPSVSRDEKNAADFLKNIFVMQVSSPSFRK